MKFIINHKDIFYWFVLCLLINGCTAQPDSESRNYYTWDGLEPDRWSSIWLVSRHIDPAAKVSILPVGAFKKNAIAIATPKSNIQRSKGYSNFENMLKEYKKVDDVGLIRIGKIINEIEISPWRSSTPAVKVVENQFRNLQLLYNRVNVPYNCYAGFFDILYNNLRKNELESSNAFLSSLSKQLEPDKICQESRPVIAVQSKNPVQEYPIDYVLKMINANKVVVFVDTREDDEFDEHHIPGAVNLKLREVDALSAKQFEDADLVISYCIKDFRGYEVAFALSKLGVKNNGIMTPYGLKGWKDLGLPVSNNKVSDAEAIEALKKRAADGA